MSSPDGLHFTERSITMKRLAGAALLCLLGAGAAGAAILKAYNGDVTFDHGLHMKSFECKECHEGGVTGKMGLNKEKAHKICLGCHKKVGAGPLKHCAECHKMDAKGS